MLQMYNLIVTSSTTSGEVGGEAARRNLAVAVRATHAARIWRILASRALSSDETETTRSVTLPTRAPAFLPLNLASSRYKLSDSQALPPVAR